MQAAKNPFVRVAVQKGQQRQVLMQPEAPASGCTAVTFLLDFAPSTEWPAFGRQADKSH